MTEETKPILARKVVVDANLTVFLGLVAEAIKDGWSIDEQNPGNLYGYLYEVHMLKDESLVDKTTSRADIMANARSAKKIRAEAATEPAKEVAPE